MKNKEVDSGFHQWWSESRIFEHTHMHVTNSGRICLRGIICIYVFLPELKHIPEVLLRAWGFEHTALMNRSVNRKCSLLVYHANLPLPDWKAAPTSTALKSKLPYGRAVAQKGALEPDFFLGQGQGGNISKWEMIRLNSVFWVSLKGIFDHGERLGALELSVKLR